MKTGATRRTLILVRPSEVWASTVLRISRSLSRLLEIRVRVSEMSPPISRLRRSAEAKRLKLGRVEAGFHVSEDGFHVGAVGVLVGHDLEFEL